MHILFVCTGNTCRSPMAAFLAKAKIAQRGLPWTVSSAGLFAQTGAPMSAHAVVAMEEREIPMQSAHRATTVDWTLVDSVDIILTMTTGHAAELRRRYPDIADKVYPLAAYVASAGDPSLPQAGGDVIDPYGGSYEVYADCASMLDGFIDQLLDILQDKVWGSQE